MLLPSACMTASFEFAGEDMVDEALILFLEVGRCHSRRAAAVGADDQGSGIACREVARFHEDPVVAVTLLRQIYDGFRCCRCVGNADEARRSGDRTGTGFRGIDIIEHDEVSTVGAVDDLHADGCLQGIAGEADMRLRLPRHGGDLDTSFAGGDAGTGADHEVAAGEESRERQRDRRG